MVRSIDSPKNHGRNIPSISTPLRGCKWRSGCKLLKLQGSVSPPWTPCLSFASDAEIPNLDVEGSTPVSRSIRGFTDLGLKPRHFSLTRKPGSITEPQRRASTSKTRARRPHPNWIRAPRHVRLEIQQERKAFMPEKVALRQYGGIRRQIHVFCQPKCGENFEVKDIRLPKFSGGSSPLSAGLTCDSSGG